MSLSDPIADMLTRVRNALERRKEAVLVPYSKTKEHIANTLKRAGLVSRVSVEFLSEDNKITSKYLIIGLRYISNSPVIEKLIRVSKPGCRQYGSPKLLGRNYRYPQYAIRIWSTSKGILTDVEAIEQNVGGEHICTVW